MRVKIIFCLGFFLIFSTLSFSSIGLAQSKESSLTSSLATLNPTESVLPQKKSTESTPSISSPNSKTSVPIFDIPNIFDNAIADAIGTILASLITGLWLSRKIWIPFILRRLQHRSLLMNKKKRRELALYLQREKERILNDSAPGALDLQVKDILEGGKLFISPPWKNTQGKTSPMGLVEYLIDELSNGHRILLLGEPGQGKTIVLKQVFTYMVDRFLANTKILTPIPLYIPLRDFTDSAYEKMDLQWIHSLYRFPLSFDEFNYLVFNKKITFLFDGFDEIMGELTQRSINARASNNIFSLPSVLTCRKLFYSLYLAMSTIKERYSLQAELLPLTLNDSIKQYVGAFCKRKQRIAPQEMSTNPEQIFETIQESEELRDLAQRPLLLVMILDVFTIPDEMIVREWNMEKVYEKYTMRWLENESGKPDSVLSLEYKITLIQEIAWSTFRREAPNPYRPYQSAVFTREEVSNILKRFPYFYQDQDFKFYEIINDVCLRTFLIANEKGRYYFIHKSFQEYYVARYIFGNVHDRGYDIDRVTQALEEIIPEEVSNFLKDMLKAKDLYVHEKDQMTNTLVKVYQQNSTNDDLRAIIRQNASYYLAVLGTQKAILFLEQNYQQEPNKWVQRGMMVGLILHCDRIDVLDKYINILRGDEKAASINIGYHLVHYGDQGIEEGYEDNRGERCNGTIQAIFRHLKSEDYRNAWALDLLTLRMLLETRKTAILHQINEGDMLFLKQFLSNGFKQQGKIFQQEKKQLQHVLRLFTKKLSGSRSEVSQ